MTEAQQPQKLEETAENTPTTLNENESAAAPAEEVQAASSAAPAPTSTPIVIEQKTSGGKGLAVGALVLSLLGLGASGFLFVQGQNLLNTQKLQLEQELDKAGLGNSQNAVLLQNTLLRQEKIEQELAKISTMQQQSQQSLESVQRAYGELLKGRVNWLVDEVEVTLNLASQQLLLSGNIPVAINVLESLEQRLSRFEQPELLPIQQAVSQDLAALKNRPYLNIPATTLHLERLQNAIPSLPLLVDGTLKEGNAAPEPVSQAGNWWTRTVDSTVSLLKSMVEVRKLDNNDAMLIAPEQAYFVRENLRLYLLDARLALLQHNGEIYQNDLNAVEATVKQYYDVQSAATQAWLKELNELKNLEIRMIGDDVLKASISAVRTYQNNARTAMPVDLPAVEPRAASTPATAPVQAASSAAAQTPSQASQPAPKAASEAASAPAATPAPAKSASQPETTRKGGAV